MAKATLKASPVETNFAFDCAAFFALTETRNGNTAALIRMVHEAISPSVTHAQIAKRLEEFAPTLAASNNVRMTVGHYAQTAALALSHPLAFKDHYADDERLSALYRIRTTGTATSRKAMVAAFPIEGDFVAYVAEWAKKERAAKTAAASASTEKVTAKVPGAKDAPKEGPAPVALPADSFKAILASLDTILAQETDPKRFTEMAKALQVRVNRAKAKTIPAKVTVAA